MSYHSDYTNPLGHHAGSIIRHVIINDSVISNVKIYSDTNARCICINPTGNKIAFIRTSDGKICIKDINVNNDVTVIGDIEPTSWIDWAHDKEIYFVKFWEHVSVKKINIETKKIETIGSFPQGIQQISVSAKTDTLLRGTAILNLTGDKFDVEQFNYKGWQIPDSSYHNYGCGTHISPNGLMFSVNPCLNHKNIYVWNWNNTLKTTLTAPNDEFWNRTRWSVNSNAWLISTIGKDSELLKYHDAILCNINDSSSIRLTNNTPGQYDEGCDFWEGNPYNVIDTTNISINFNRHKKILSKNIINLKIQVNSNKTITIFYNGIYSIYIYTINGKPVKRYSASGSKTFNINELSVGTYLIRCQEPNGLYTTRKFILN